jgi:hypothetical protein
VDKGQEICGAGRGDEWLLDDRSKRGAAGGVGERRIEERYSPEAIGEAVRKALHGASPEVF